MKKQPPYKIGSYLKHNSGIIIRLERYDTQLVQALFLSIGGGSSKIMPNYNYLFGIDVKKNKPFKGLTKDFELINL